MPISVDGVPIEEPVWQLENIRKISESKNATNETKYATNETKGATNEAKNATKVVLSEREGGNYEEKEVTHFVYRKQSYLF